VPLRAVGGTESTEGHRDHAKRIGRYVAYSRSYHRGIGQPLGPTEVGKATLLSSRPDRERLRARQPTSQITSRGQRVGVWAQPSGVLRGRAPVTLGGKIESASAGPGKRAGAGPFALTHLLYRPSYGSPARRAAAPRNEQSAHLFELVGGDESGRGRVCLRSGLDFTAPNARPWTCFDALYESKRVAWSRTRSRLRQGEHACRGLSPMRVERRRCRDLGPTRDGFASGQVGRMPRASRVTGRPGRVAGRRRAAERSVGGQVGRMPWASRVAGRPGRVAGRWRAAERSAGGQVGRMPRASRVAGRPGRAAGRWRAVERSAGGQVGRMPWASRVVGRPGRAAGRWRAVERRPGRTALPVALGMSPMWPGLPRHLLRLSP
jgi:hypothetical protein